MITDFKLKTKLRYELEFIRNGKVFAKQPFREHMITDWGYNRINQELMLTMISTGLIGDNVSPTPIRRDSGAVTFTQSGTTITASSSFFDSSDTGRLFKWGASGSGSGGVEGYLTYISATSAAYSVSQTVSTPTAGVIWYVNTSALASYISGLSWSKVTGALNQFTQSGTSGNTCTLTHHSVIQSSTLGASYTLTEIAFWSGSGTPNTANFDRDLISPPVAVISGDQVRATIELINTYTSITSVSQSNVGTGCDTTGNFQIESLLLQDGVGIASLDSNGNIISTNGVHLEPSSGFNLAVYNQSFSLQTFSVATGPNTNLTRYQNSISSLSYTADTYYREGEWTVSVSDAVGTIYGWSLGQPNFNGRGVTWVLTTPFSKSSLEQLKIRFRKSWNRILTN